MRIDLLTSNDPRVPNVAAALSLWRVGAILDATAVRDPTTGQLWLNFDGKSLPARIASGDSAGPAEGEQLKLRVLRESPVLALEVVDANVSTDIVGDALRRNLPRQSIPTPLLANLSWLARTDAPSAVLPLSISMALMRLWQALPTADSLSDPAALLEALNRSGVFLEAELARDTTRGQIATTLGQDLKALLLALKHALDAQGARGTPKSDAPTPPGPLPMLRGALTAITATPASLTVIDDPHAQLDELARQTEGSLARVNTTQLLNAEAAQSGIAAWLIELPVRRDDRVDLLRFRFEREPQSKGAEEASWAVETAIDLGSSGTLHARVSMQRKRLAIQLRSESALLIEALERNTPMLSNALKAEGLAIDRIVCLHGAPIRDPGGQAARLLDLHA